MKCIVVIYVLPQSFINHFIILIIGYTIVIHSICEAPRDSYIPIPDSWTMTETNCKDDINKWKILNFRIFLSGQNNCIFIKFPTKLPKSQETVWILHVGFVSNRWRKQNIVSDNKKTIFGFHPTVNINFIIG